MKKSFSLSLSAIFAGLTIMSASQAMAQEQAQDANDFKQGALIGVTEMFDFPFGVTPDGLEIVAKHLYADKSDAFRTGFVAGAKCTDQMATSLMTHSGIYDDGGINTDLYMHTAYNTARATVAYDAAALCRQAFVARHQLGL